MEDRNARYSLEQKLREKITADQKELRSEIERLIPDNDSLVDETRKLNDKKIQLLDEKQRKEEMNRQWTNKVEGITSWIQTNDKPQEDIQVEELTEPKDEIKKQALHTEAEDLAIEDAQYFLDKSLQKGTIDLIAFLKATRSLCADQFYKRALLNKIRKQHNV